jgi:hypothetical protein
MKLLFMVYVEPVGRAGCPTESRMANCRTEVRPTFITLSPFTKGDAFRCRQATERRGLWCSAVELKSVLQQQPTISKSAKSLLPLYPPQGARLPQARCACGGQGGQQPPPVSRSESPPSASTVCVRQTWAGQDTVHRLSNEVRLYQLPSRCPRKIIPADGRDHV